MKEICRACKKEIEENRTHAGLCDKCVYSNRKPRIIITHNEFKPSLVEEFY